MPFPLFPQDSIDKRLPTLVFGGVAILAALLALLLPETLHKEMPQTIKDGEHFGKGDTGYGKILACAKGRKQEQDLQTPDDGATECFNAKSFNATA